MNHLLVLAAIACFAAAAASAFRRFRKGGGCCGEHASSVRRTGAADRDTSHYPHRARLEIGGMTCTNCAARVENALNALPGTLARVRFDDHTAVVLTKDLFDRHAAAAAVARAGYAVLSCEIEK